MKPSLYGVGTRNETVILRKYTVLYTKVAIHWVVHHDHTDVIKLKSSYPMIVSGVHCARNPVGGAVAPDYAFIQVHAWLFHCMCASEGLVDTQGEIMRIFVLYHVLL